MIIISSDNSKQTYVPGARVFSLNLLFYKKKHPKTLEYVSLHDSQNSIIFPLENVPHIPHLGFLTPLAHFSFC